MTVKLLNWRFKETILRLLQKINQNLPSIQSRNLVSIYEQGLNKDAKVEVKVIPPSTTGENYVESGGYGCACADYRGVLYVYDAPSSGSK